MHSLTQLRSFCALYIKSFWQNYQDVMLNNFAKILGKCRENLGKMVKCKILVKRLGLGISWESLEKMLVNCRRNVGKIFGKYY